MNCSLGCQTKFTVPTARLQLLSSLPCRARQGTGEQNPKKQQPHKLQPPAPAGHTGTMGEDLGLAQQSMEGIYTLKELEKWGPSSK